jgi:hypothetical protein
LPQTQKHVHNIIIKTNQLTNKSKEWDKPCHMYIRCQNTQKSKGIKKGEKIAKKKSLKSQCILNVSRRFSKYACCPKLVAPTHELCFLPQT